MWDARGSFALTLLFMIAILSVQYRVADGRSTVRWREHQCLPVSLSPPLHYRAIRPHCTSKTRIGWWIIVTCQNQVSATFELMPPPLKNDWVYYSILLFIMLRGQNNECRVAIGCDVRSADQ